MKLSIKALTTVCGLLWGGCLLFVGLVNLAAPPYGANLLAGVSSIYPGFHASHTVADVLVGTAYALLDGAIGGALFGWLYNLFASRVDGQ